MDKEQLQQLAERLYPVAIFERRAWIAGASWKDQEVEQIKKDSAAQAEALRRTAEKCDRLQREVQELRAWKKEALACTPDWQAIGKALNLRLGTSVSDQVLPGILNLLKDKRELVLQLRRLQSYCLHYVKAYEKTQRCREVEQTLNKYDHTVIPES